MKVYFSKRSLKISALTSIVLFITVLGLQFFKQSALGDIRPQPIQDILLKDSAEKRAFRESRIEWIEQMHRTAPGTDWRQIEAQNHLSKLSQRMTSSYVMPASSLEIIPGALEVEWKEIGSNNLAGRMLYSTIDWTDSVLYAASEGGNIWYRDWPEGSWSSMNDHFNIDHIIFLKSYRNTGLHRMIAVNEDAHLYYSDDFGTNWQSSQGFNGPQNWGNFRRTVMTPDAASTLYVLAKEWDYNEWVQSVSIYKSDNFGESFSKIYTRNLASETCDLWCDATTSSSCFFMQEDSLFKLEGANLTFISKVPYSQSIEKTHLAGRSAATDIQLYAGFSMGNSTQFFYSIDGGSTWTQSGLLGFRAFDVNSICASQTYPGRILFGGVECYQSDDYGQNWSIVNSWGEYYSDMFMKLHADIPAIQSYVLPTGAEKYFISTDGGLYVADNPLISVENLSMEGLRVSQYYSVYSNQANPELIYTGSQDQGFQASIGISNDLVDFEQTISGDYGHLVSGDGGQSIWSVYPSFLMYYDDLSAGFSASYFSFQGSNYLWMPPLCEHPYASDKVLMGGGGLTGGAHIFEFSFNGSISQSELPFDFSQGVSDVQVAAIGFSSLEPNHWYALTNTGDFFYSSDDGTTWTQNISFSAPESHYFYGSDIVTSPVDPAIVYVSGSGYSNAPVYVSNNYGQSFTAINVGLPSTLVYEMAINKDGDLLFAASEAGAFVYVDSLNRWFDLAGNVAPDQVYWGVEYIQSIDAVRFATYGRGVWQCSIHEIAAIIDAVNLTVNVYPNPASESIYLKGDELQGAIVQLFNQSGQRVFSAECKAENLQIDIRRLQKGSYFLQLSKGVSRKTTKVIHI
ncbi:MAG: T9SS type A sorting domain-containing protein [Bacteroidales bacterium]|nr:T9SS type A sorting domain-containing protein [Bacteroidales bacterium]